MKKAINMQRPDLRRIQLNAEDIQFIEEASTEGHTNVMIRHYGQVTVNHDFEEVRQWLDMLWGRKHVIADADTDEAEGPKQETEPWEADEGDDEETAVPLHTKESSKSVLRMMGKRRPDARPSSDS